MRGATIKEAMNTNAGNSDARVMRRFNFLALILGALVLCGCARYDMVLTNGQRLENIRKPKRDATGGYYSFIDAKGRTNVISEARVVSIAPHQESTFKSSQ